MAKPKGYGVYDTNECLSIRLLRGQKQKLQNIPNWRNDLREIIDQYINENTTETGNKKASAETLARPK